MIETPKTVVTSPSSDLEEACGALDVQDPSSSSSLSPPANHARRFAMLSPPSELDLRSLPSTPLEYQPFQSSPLFAVNEDSSQPSSSSHHPLPPAPPPKSPRSPSAGPFPFPSVGSSSSSHHHHRRKTSTASHTSFPRTSVASTASTTSGTSSSMPPIPARSPRRPSAKSTASFTGLLKEFDLAPNSPLPISPNSVYSTTTNGSPDPNYAPQPRVPPTPNRPLPRRPSDASVLSQEPGGGGGALETMLNSNPSLTSFTPTLTPEMVLSTAASTPNASSGCPTPPLMPATSKRKHALLELLSSERAYAADLALVRDIHIPLSRGLPPPFDPPSSSQGMPLSQSASAHSSSPRSSTHTSSSAQTSLSASTAPSSVGPVELPMPPEASRIIFGNIDEIAVFADRFSERLEEALGDVVEGGQGEDRVGELFLEVIPIMSPLYKAYITRHPTALAQFQSLPPCAALSSYLAQTRALTTSHTNAWDIPSLLIKPVQRLLKYPLLLGTIYNETSDSHGDKASLLEAKERIEEVARMVNEGRRRWEVVKAVLNQNKANSSANGSAAGATLTRGGPPKIGRMRSFRTKMRSATSENNADLDRGRVELEQWERRIKECEVVVKDVARHALEWNREVDASLKRLKGWNSGFGSVVGLGTEGVEAVGAFGKVVTGIQERSADFHMRLQTVFLPQLSLLLRTLTSPRTLLTHMHTLRHSHITLLNTPYNKSRPPSALIEASNDYLALQATLREELPQYILLFEKGLAVLLVEFSNWQRDLWQEINQRWVAFWAALAVEGDGEEDLADIASGGAETIKIWKERFHDVEAAVGTFRIVHRPAKIQPTRRDTSSTPYRQTNGSSLSILDQFGKPQQPLSPPLYQSSRSQSSHDLFGTSRNESKTQSWESIERQLEQSAHTNKSTPSLRSKHKRSGSAATDASIPVPPPPPPPPPAPPLMHSRSDMTHMMGSGALMGPVFASKKDKKLKEPKSPTKEKNAKPKKSEGLQVPRLVEPFAQDAGVGRAFAPSPVPSAPMPLSPRADRSRPKERSKPRDKDDNASLRATSPRPFRRRLTDSLFGLPRSSSHGRSKSMSSELDLAARPLSPPPDTSQRRVTTHGDQRRDENLRTREFKPIPPLSLPAEAIEIPAPMPSPLEPPSSPLYTCTTIVPFLPNTRAKYMDLPMLRLHVGDTCQVLFEAGHPSVHQELPIYVDEGDDCLLVARDEAGRIGWVLASFLVPLA